MCVLQREYLWVALVMGSKTICVHDENTKHEAEQYAQETR